MKAILISGRSFLTMTARDALKNNGFELVAEISAPLAAYKIVKEGGIYLIVIVLSGDNPGSDDTRIDERLRHEDEIIAMLEKDFPGIATLGIVPNFQGPRRESLPRVDRLIDVAADGWITALGDWLKLFRAA